MIPKVTRGSDTGGLVKYLLDTDPARIKTAHVDPHLVAGSPEVMAWWGTDVLSAEEGRPIGRELDSAMRAHRTKAPDGRGSTWHCSLSLRADEGKLTDEQWGKIAQEFVASMGFDDPDSGESPCKWAAVYHGPSRGGNEHIHIALNLIREDGRPADVFRDYIRAQRAARDIERRHNLRPVAERGRATRGLSRRELERQKDRRASEPERRYLERAVRGTAAQSASEAEFVSALRGAGLAPRPWYAKGAGTSIVGGYSVQAAGSPIRLGGKNLAQDLSLPRLRAAHGWVPGAEAVAAWESTRSWRPARGVEPDPVAWQQGAAEITRLREFLGTVPLEDTRTWTVAAHELAGLLAAGSLASEGGVPGPLAEAADSLSVSAQVRGRDTVPRPESMPDTRGAARLVASAARGGQGSVAEAALWLQVRNAARAVHDAHIAVADAHRAQEIAVVMRGRLAELTRPAVQQEQTAVRQVTAVVERPRTIRGGPEEQRGRGR